MEGLVVAVAVALVVIFISSLVVIKAKMVCRNLPPGKFGCPIIGETMEFIKATREGCPDKFVSDRIERYGSTVFRSSIFGEPMAFLCGPAGNKFIFSNEGKKVVQWFPATIRLLAGRSLVFMNGDEARVRKKLMAEGFFNAKVLKTCVPRMDELTRDYFDTNWRGKEDVNVLSSTKFYTFDSVCRLVVSITEPELISRLLGLYHVFIEGTGDLPFNIPGTRFHRAMRAGDTIKNELKAFLRRRRTELERKEASPLKDILSYLLMNADETGMLMTEAEIINEISVLLFAGHNMTSSAICSLVKYLSDQPSVCEKVRKEQEEIAASRAWGELLTWDDLQRMKYSWNVVCEVLRIAPPFTNTFREAKEDLTYDGYTIPKGWKLSWGTAYTHKDPSSYPNPKDFDESRFEGTGPPPFSFIPFGGGHKLCLGKEFVRLHILVFLHNLIVQFDWDLLIRDELFSYQPIFVPVKGLPVRPRPRISD